MNRSLEKWEKFGSNDFCALGPIRYEHMTVQLTWPKKTKAMSKYKKYEKIFRKMGEVWVQRLLCTGPI